MIIILGSYMVRYPLGGNLSWALQYIAGFKALGHDVYVVEKYVHEDCCFDPLKKHMGNDCSYGVGVVADLLKKHGLEDKWCFVEYGDIYHGLSKQKIENVFRSADLYIENGAHGVWETESAWAAHRVYIDVDPAFTQVNFHRKLNQQVVLPGYDHYFTNGMNIGREGNIIPTCGITWKYIFNPVHLPLFDRMPAPEGAPYSTIMNWVSYNETVNYKGVTYGHKSMEFDKFLTLPRNVDVPMEIAVSGLLSPKREELLKNNWRIISSQEVTFTVDTFRKYLSSCRGEFSVVKNMYQATDSGWFSDKSAAFMASGRPVILQETGFSDHLPVGEGLFAVENIEEAAEAIETVEGNYAFHSDKAYELAAEYLDTGKVLSKFLKDAGL